MNNVDFPPNGEVTVIKGAFINARKMSGNVLENFYMIKLSSIISIYPYRDEETGEEGNECVFYTFKDTYYHAHISATNLRLAINKFLFDPEKCDTYL